MMVKVQLVMSERQSPIVAVLILSQAGGDNSSDGEDPEAGTGSQNIWETNVCFQFQKPVCHLT